MKPLTHIDSSIFAALRGLIRSIDAVLPFRAKHLARILLGVYLVGDIGSAVLNRGTLSLGWTVLAVLLIVPQIERMGRRRYSLENSPRRRIVRLLTTLIFGLFILSDLFLRDHLWLLSHISYPLLMYVMDMDSEDSGGGRRRVLDALREEAPRPGLSTALSPI